MIVGIVDKRRLRKHDADRYCACNIMKIPGPLMNEILLRVYYDCRHRKKHDADRYCACNIMKLQGPVDERDTFEGVL